MKVYTVAEVADILKIEERTVRRYIRDGMLKASRLGNRYRITEEQLKAFLKATETGKESFRGGDKPSK